MGAPQMGSEFTTPMPPAFGPSMPDYRPVFLRRACQTLTTEDAGRLVRAWTTLSAANRDRAETARHNAHAAVMETEGIRPLSGMAVALAGWFTGLRAELTVTVNALLIPTDLKPTVIFAVHDTLLGAVAFPFVGDTFTMEDFTMLTAPWRTSIGAVPGAVPAVSPVRYSEYGGVPRLQRPPRPRKPSVRSPIQTFTEIRSADARVVRLPEDYRHVDVGVVEQDGNV